MVNAQEVISVLITMWYCLRDEARVLSRMLYR